MGYNKGEEERDIWRYGMGKNIRYREMKYCDMWVIKKRYGMVWVIMY